MSCRRPEDFVVAVRMIAGRADFEQELTQWIYSRDNDVRATVVEEVIAAVKVGELSLENWDEAYLRSVIGAASALAAPPAGPREQPQVTRADGWVQTIPWPGPTLEMFNDDPTFEAVWQAIKRWDINVPGAYSGHMGATGNHVRAILDAIHEPPAPPAGVGAEPESMRKESWLRQLLIALAPMTIPEMDDFADGLEANLLSHGWQRCPRAPAGTGAETRETERCLDCRKPITSPGCAPAGTGGRR